MEQGKARHTATLYNTTLDICGHEGMLVEAGKILARMIARNVRPNERTIASILNAIAERARTLGQATEPALQVERINGSAEENQRPPHDTNEQGGLPGQEAFNVRSREDAVKLAIRLYASWIEHWRGPASLFAFNALLKVLWRAEGGHLLPKVFPLAARSSSLRPTAAWVPSQPDLVSYSTAMLAASTHPETPWELATRYWKEGLLASGLTADSPAIVALLVALQRDLARRGDNLRLAKTEIDQLRGTLSEALGHLHRQDVVPAKATNIALNVACRLGCFREAQEHWRTRCWEPVRQRGSFKACHERVDADTVALIMRIMTKDGRPQEALDTFGELTDRHGMHITTAILDEALLAHRRAKSPHEAVRLFERLVRDARSVPPSTQTVYHTLLAIRECAETKVQRPAAYAKVLTLLSTHHPDLHRQVMQKGSLQKILGDSATANRGLKQNGSTKS